MIIIIVDVDFDAQLTRVSPIFAICHHEPHGTLRRLFPEMANRRQRPKTEDRDRYTLVLRHALLTVTCVYHGVSLHDTVFCPSRVARSHDAVCSRSQVANHSRVQQASACCTLPTWSLYNGTRSCMVCACMVSTSVAGGRHCRARRVWQAE